MARKIREIPVNYEILMCVGVLLLLAFSFYNVVNDAKDDHSGNSG